MGGRDFQVEVEVHQGSLLSPLNFCHCNGSTVTISSVTDDCLGSCCMQMIWYSMADTEDELIEKLQRWKIGLERS